MQTSQIGSKSRPSRGCNKCRQRKVKCDEGHPSCDRCIKGGFDCVYRDGFDLVLRNETEDTAIKAQRKWRSRAKKPDCNTSPIPSNSATSPSSSSCTDSPETRDFRFVTTNSPCLDVEQSIIDLAAKRFVFDFMVEEAPQIPKTSHATFVPGIVQRMAPGTCTYHAFRATSLFNFAARGKSPLAAEMARKEYGKAIQLLGQDISKLQGVEPLRTLIAVSLLSLFEILASPILTHGGSWQAHVSGACAVLNMFYAKGNGSEDDMDTLSELFQHVIIQMLVSSMTLGKRPEIPLSTIDIFIRPKTIMHQILSIMYRAADVLADWRAAELSITDPMRLSFAAMTLITEVEAVDAEIEQWFSNRPQNWEEAMEEAKIDQMPPWLQDLYRTPGAPTTHLMSSTFLIGQRYNLLRGTSIQLHSYALNALDVLIASAPTNADIVFWLETQNRFGLRAMQNINNILFAVYGQMTLPMRGRTVQKNLEDVPTLRVTLLIWSCYRIGMLLTRRETMAMMDVEGRRFWARAFLCWVRDKIGIKKCAAFVDNIDGALGLTFG